MLKEMTSSLCLFTFMLIFCHWGSASETEIQNMNTPEIRQLFRRGLGNLWTWIQSRGKTQDNFIGRCFGAVKRLSMIMPIVLIKLGVILTTLVFLTIFSLKSLGLLGLLLVINTSGIATKLALGKHDDSKYSSRPQNVHFHIHQDKSGHYNVDHSGSYDSGWYDKSDLFQNDDESLVDRLKRLHVFDSSYT